MQARLVTIRNGTVETVYPVEASGTVYGRAGGNLVQILDPDVSKRHMHIYRQRDQWRIEDLASKNGTYVNGTRVQNGYLQYGDTIRIGNTTLYFIHGTGDDLPLTGQPIDISRNAYQQTMSAPRPAAG